jgi:hypothetical protein
MLIAQLTYRGHKGARFKHFIYTMFCEEGRRTMRTVLTALIIGGLLVIGTVGMATEHEEASQGVIQQGPALVAQGDYKRVLDMIAALPAEERNNIQVRTLECFANLKGWVSDKDPVRKMDWWGLRIKLLYVGDPDATPVSASFLKDPNPYLRKYAAELLGYIGDKRALDDLSKVKEHDENSSVRKYAGWAYKQISGGLTPVAASDLPPLAAPQVQIPVAMEVAGPIAQSKRISFVNSTGEFKVIFLATLNYKKYYADFQAWGDIIIAQLEDELQNRGVVVIPAADTVARRVVIGVLDLEGSATGGTRTWHKKALMEKLKQNPLVRLVDIPAYSTRSDLKGNGYEKADGYRKDYQVDMVLHVRHIESTYDFCLIDLYTKKDTEVSLQTENGLIDELTAERLSTEVLVSQYLNQVVRSKRKAAATQGGGVTPESDYVFNVAVQDIKLIEGAWATRCIVTVLVERADGHWSHTYEGNNASPASLERAIDGAVYRAVEAIIKDSGFRGALSQ